MAMASENSGIYIAPLDIESKNTKILPAHH